MSSEDTMVAGNGISEEDLIKIMEIKLQAELDAFKKRKAVARKSENKEKGSAARTYIRGDKLI